MAKRERSLTEAQQQRIADAERGRSRAQERLFRYLDGLCSKAMVEAYLRDMMVHPAWNQFRFFTRLLRGRAADNASNWP